MQTVQNLKDALTQCRATNYRVVNNHEVVLVGAQRAVADVIDVGCQIVALAVVRNESTHLDVFPDNLFLTLLAMQLTETVRHAVIGYLSGVGNI